MTQQWLKISERPEDLRSEMVNFTMQDAWVYCKKASLTQNNYIKRFSLARLTTVHMVSISYLQWSVQSWSCWQKAPFCCWLMSAIKQTRSVGRSQLYSWNRRESEDDAGQWNMYSQCYVPRTNNSYKDTIEHLENNSNNNNNNNDIYLNFSLGLFSGPFALSAQPYEDSKSIPYLGRSVFASNAPWNTQKHN